MQKNPKGGFSAHSGAKKAQKWGFSKKLSKNRQIKSSQVICDPKSQLFMSQFLNFQSETKIVKITHSASDTLNNISLRYNVSVAELKKVNNIWSDQDFYGLKRIKVPAFGGAPVLNQPSAPSMDID